MLFAFLLIFQETTESRIFADALIIPHMRLIQEVKHVISAVNFNFHYCITFHTVVNPQWVSLIFTASFYSCYL